MQLGALLGLQPSSTAAGTVHHPITWSIVSLFTLRWLHLPQPCSPSFSTCKLTLPLHTPQSSAVLNHLCIPLVSGNNMAHFNYTFRKCILYSYCPFGPIFYCEPREVQVNYKNRNCRTPKLKGLLSSALWCSTQCRCRRTHPSPPTHTHHRHITHMCAHPSHRHNTHAPMCTPGEPGTCSEQLINVAHFWNPVTFSFVKSIKEHLPNAMRHRGEM